MPSSTPRLIKHKEVWFVADHDDGRSSWTRVGTAFENSDGSYTVRLSALPVGGGRMSLRDPLAPLLIATNG